MTKYTTTRQALEAYMRGSATLDEVSDAADRSIQAYFKRRGVAPIETSSSKAAPSS